MPFYFETLLNEGLTGIDRTAMLTTITGIAYAILVIGFLVGLYQSAMRGGDLQALGVTAIKYVVIAIIVANWSTVFREVNASFSQVAHAIYSSSTAGDVFLSWLDKLKQQFETDGATSFLNLISDANSALITVVLVFLAYHLGAYSRTDGDPLKPLMTVYKIDAKAIAKTIKAEVDAKIASIETTLKKRKTKAHQKAA